MNHARRAAARTRLLPTVALLTAAIGLPAWSAAPAIAHGRSSPAAVAPGPSSGTAARPAVDTWTTPRTLWQAPRGSTAPAALRQVVDDTGVVTVAWLSRRGSVGEVYASRYQSRAWTTPRRIATTPWVVGQTVASLRLALGPGRQVVAAWFTSPSTQPETGSEVGAVTWTGSAWGRPVVLGRYPGDRLDGFGVVGHDTGVTVMWQVSRDLSTVGTLRVSDGTGGVWSSPTVLDTAARPLPGPVAARAGAGARVVWAAGGVTSDVRSAASTVPSAGAATTGWGPAETLSAGAEPGELAAAGDGDGREVVAWSQRGTSSAVSAVVRAPGSTWGPVTALPLGPASATRIDSLVAEPGSPLLLVTRQFQPKDIVGSATAHQWSGTEWSALPPSSATARYASATLLTLGKFNDGNVYDPATRSWLESSVWSGSSWPRPTVLSGTRTGFVDGWAGTALPSNGYVVVYGRRPTARTSGVWATRLVGGGWRAPVPVAPQQVSQVRNYPTTPVAGPDGTVTATWTAGSRVVASRSR